MPIHDWTRVEAGIFHAFHHGWLSELCRALNQGLLPDDCYALPEQVAASTGLDVSIVPDHCSEAEFYRRKKSAIAVRHVSGDRLVAMIEILSPGNKGSRNTFRAFVE